MPGKNRISKIIVFDLEMTCWEDRDKTMREGEIIEFGAVPLNIHDSIVELDLGFSSLIKPVKTEISNYCTELTGITQDDILKSAKPFDEVMRTVDKKFSSNYPSGAWGNVDIKKLKSACKEYSVKMPISEDCVNLKTMTCMLMGRSRPVGLDKILDELGIKPSGTRHRALVDSIDTAFAFLKALKKK